MALDVLASGPGDMLWIVLGMIVAVGLSVAGGILPPSLGLSEGWLALTELPAVGVTLALVWKLRFLPNEISLDRDELHIGSFSVPLAEIEHLEAQDNGGMNPPGWLELRAGGRTRRWRLGERPVAMAWMVRAALLLQHQPEHLLEVVGAPGEVEAPDDPEAAVDGLSLSLQRSTMGGWGPLRTVLMVLSGLAFPLILLAVLIAGTAWPVVFLAVL